MKTFQKIENFCIEKKLISQQDKIVVGISGGADSVFLLTFLNQIKEKYDLTIIAVHVNYHLRGEDSNQDEEFVKSFCFFRNIPILVKSVNLKTDSNLEAKARKIRFDFFKKIIKNYSADKIALGHNRGDQAETILFKLFRGSGLKGISGIKPKNELIIRPLLDVSKDEIKKYLKTKKITWCEDKSNHSNKFSRNKIRNFLIPWIQDNFNPNIEKSLFQLSQIVSDIDDWVEKYSRRKLTRLTKYKNKNSISLDYSKLLEMLPTFRFYIFQNAFQRLTNLKTDFYSNHFKEIEKLLKSEGSAQIKLHSNIFVRKEYQKKLIFVKIEDSRENQIKNLVIDNYRLRFVFRNSRFSMRKIKKLPPKKKIIREKNICYLDFDKIQLPITIRLRKPGDKFIPFGMKKEKKLKNFFIDEKIPKYDRDNVPLLCDKNDIIWVCKYRINQKYSVTKQTKKILKITIQDTDSIPKRSAIRKKRN